MAGLKAGSKAVQKGDMTAGLKVAYLVSLRVAWMVFQRVGCLAGQKEFQTAGCSEPLLVVKSAVHLEDCSADSTAASMEYLWAVR